MKDLLLCIAVFSGIGIGGFMICVAIQRWRQESRHFIDVRSLLFGPGKSMQNEPASNIAARAVFVIILAIVSFCVRFRGR